MARNQRGLEEEKRQALALLVGCSSLFPAARFRRGATNEVGNEDDDGCARKIWNDMNMIWDLVVMGHN